MSDGAVDLATDGALPLPRDDDLSFLSGLPCFASLSVDELAEVQEGWRRLDPEPGEIIVSESQATDALYVVRHGRVRLFKTSRAGKEQVLFVHGPGATFNEEVIGDGGPAIASAQVMDAGARLYALPISLMTQLLESNGRFATQIVRTLAQRVRGLASLVEDLSFRDTAQRVIKLLLEESEGTGMVMLTKQEMAARVGAAREVVSRVLHDLEHSGLIRRQHDGLINVHTRALRERMAGRRH
jgi:CRP/FNR family cyclic AMP-dependent transcriptional regulator